VAVPHLENVPGSVVSFGQGCEGEPLTQSDLLERAIGLIREQTSSGTINLNTNGSMPHALKRLFRAGLDSIRISLNSAREDYYNSYFMPVNYTFGDVVDSLLLGSTMGRFVSINYFVFPGFTDEQEEVHALESLLKQTGVDMIQWRNLNIDPDYYMDSLNWKGTGKNIGMLALLERIREAFPDLRFGYFNPALK
jgi:pyruvate-formate lyase-activating enzyme